jgi:hypothetical protein
VAENVKIPSPEAVEAIYNGGRFNLVNKRLISSFRGDANGSAQSAARWASSPESILSIVVMDSGLAPSGRAPE